MSYDICLNDPKTGCVITFDEPIPVSGGTFALGGTREAWLNVTYNYGSHYRRVMGEKGIRTVYGMTGKESLPVLDAAIDALGDDVSSNYWDATEGNAKAALRNLALLAGLAPHGVWDGD